MADRQVRLGDFSGQAEAYALARPGYPPALVDDLLDYAGLASGDPVVELGAGTGLFTRLLSGRGLVVTAIEPNQAMRERVPALPDVTWRDGSFEATGLGSGSQRWAVAAQAFHWADPERALPEMRRILAPAGHFTVLWNDRQNERSAVLQRTVELIRLYAPEYDEAYRQRTWETVLVSTGDFAGVVRHAREHVVAMSRARYLGLWRSHNRLNVTAGPVRFAAFIAELDRYLADEALDVVEVPYLTEAWTARRSDGRD
jgi:SAM-dependent methyltransferase